MSPRKMIDRDVKIVRRETQTCQDLSHSDLIGIASSIFKIRLESAIAGHQFMGILPRITHLIFKLCEFAF